MVDYKIYMEEKRRKIIFLKKKRIFRLYFWYEVYIFKEILYYHTRDFRFFSGYKHCW